MNLDDARQKILEAVDSNFDAQLATTRDFVAIPSTRGAEGHHDRRNAANDAA